MEKSIKIPKIKICGITSREEAEYLNQEEADYAGFVFYEKSRRNVSIREAEALLSSLSEKILPVAVTVSPSVSLVRKIEKLGFAVLQVHGDLAQEIRKGTALPIWRAVNITDAAGLDAFFQKEETEGKQYINGYLADGNGYGRGRPFDWRELSGHVRALAEGKRLILAGGLTEENVKLGIRSFLPDVVDVSSGVEENGKKSRTKIEAFIRKVKEDE